MATATKRRGVGELEVVRGDVVEGHALELETRIKEGLREVKGGLWKAAEAVYEFDQQQGWAELGHENLSGWLASPEIDMTRGTYYRLRKAWMVLAVDNKTKPELLESVDLSKAAIVVEDVASGRVRATTALKDAAQMTAEQLREKYEKPRRGRPPKGQERGDRRGIASGRRDTDPALKAAAGLPWDWVEQAVSGRVPIALREARLKEALGALLAWRQEFLD